MRIFRAPIWKLILTTYGSTRRPILKSLNLAHWPCSALDSRGCALRAAAGRADSKPDNSEGAEARAANWAKGDAEAATALVDRRMIRALTLYGTAAECRDRLAEYRDAGRSVTQIRNTVTVHHYVSPLKLRTFTVAPCR